VRAIKLTSRIRNWQDLKFFRPAPDTRYGPIDALFKDTVDWSIIEVLWKDLMRVVLSTSAGKISSVTLLCKWGNDNRKNRLYQAFHELPGMASSGCSARERAFSLPENHL
jgi:TnpA family transposase